VSAKIIVEALSACAWVTSNEESAHIMTFNDAHSHDEVVALWQATIKSLRRIREAHKALAAAKEVQP